METYRVVSITDRKGNPRIEGRYPLRVGRMCKKPTPRNGDAMMIEMVGSAGWNTVCRHDCYEYSYRIQD